ncbi:MAG: DNA replication/repair protein RecF [Candidatus Baltobacteraceae bacterium]
MRLTRLSLSNVRNYSTLDFSPAPGLNVFVGENAQGKSNLLESISLLGTGKSFRTSKESDLIREGFDLATISGDAEVRAGALRLSCSIGNGRRGTRKQYAVNGQSVRYAKFLGSIRVVTFIPADLQLVSGAPSLRRAMLNGALSQDTPLYYRDLARYQKALSQKAALLRGTIEPNPELLGVYNAILIEAGSALILARRNFVTAVNAIAQQMHSEWIGNLERFEMRYQPNLPLSVPTLGGIAAVFTARLAELGAIELLRKTTLVGPHRDDVEFLLDGRSLAAYGSQGQQRTAVLAIKIAEYTVMHERSGEAPLLLLDDVLSELDAGRAQAFLAGVAGCEQAFITATSLSPPLNGAHIHTISAASLRPLS